MDDPPVGPVRDGLLALVALGALLDALRRRGALRTLRSTGTALVGTTGVVGIEALMLRYPERTRDLWERPAVRILGLLGTVLGGRALTRGRGGRATAAFCWGLLAYLVLLGSILVGRENPVARLVGPAAW
ncbi:MAG: hypothetical protein V5A62_02970 [Haloarculaceae archaeon]